jgi:GST-like protein
MHNYTLYGYPGWGSCIIEAQLAYYGLPFEVVDVGDLFKSEAARAQVLPMNALAQVPVLVLPNGEAMSESAAISLHLADLVGNEHLVPGPQAPERAKFLRWLVYLVANIYPVFTYGDIPERFVSTEGAAQPFREALDAHLEKLWLNMANAAAADGPWFLGERLSALDFYLLVMTRWRPKPPWFAKHTPKLASSARAAAQLPGVGKVFERHFASVN